jgi:hypothetical protein
MRNKWVAPAAAAAVLIVAGIGVWKLRKRAQAQPNGEVDRGLHDGGAAN